MRHGETDIKQAFEEAKIRYKTLENVDIDLKFSNEWFFTMRASISLRSFFSQKRKYSVIVNLRRAEILSRLSRAETLGWFGHELAHIVDYETMSNRKLRSFVIKYAFNPPFRFSVERRINAFACNHGFASELFAVWNKFVFMNIASKRYHNYIIRHYVPHWDDVKEQAEAAGISRQDYEDLQKIQKSV